MDKEEKTWLLIAGVIGVIVILALVLRYAGLLDLAADQTYSTTAYGQNFTYKGNFGDVTNANCNQTLNDLGALHFSGTAQDKGSLCNYNLGSSVTLTSIDWSKQKNGVIHRHAGISVYTKGANAGGMGSTINGISGDLVTSGDLSTGRSMAGNAGDVYFTNDGTTVTVRSGPYVQTFSASTPFYYTDSIGSNSNGMILYDYQITGVEVTPFPTNSSSTNPVNNPSPGTTANASAALYPTTQVYIITEAATSWWDRFIAWLRSIFA